MAAQMSEKMSRTPLKSSPLFIEASVNGGWGQGGARRSVQTSLIKN